MGFAVAGPVAPKGVPLYFLFLCLRLASLPLDIWVVGE